MTDASGIDPATVPLAWERFYSGKVRDLYRSPDRPGRLLIIATDRVSAFDHVLEPSIPGKGALLTRLSRWWFAKLDGVPNHLAPDAEATAIGDVGPAGMLVRELQMYPIECVVRGYLAGSGWAEYRRSGSVCGVPLPAGLIFGGRLPEPIYTPAFKAPAGEHDENISFERTVELVGPDVAAELRDRSLEAFAAASSIAAERGLILADTKFEFGADPVSGVLTLGDEVLTSDSSRYWDAEAWAAGERSASYDKQIVRDWLAAHWDRTGDPPKLPSEIVTGTVARYQELVDRLTAP